MNYFESTSRYKIRISNTENYILNLCSFISTFAKQDFNQLTMNFEKITIYHEQKSFVSILKTNGRKKKGKL